MDVKWLMGIVHEKHRDVELDEALERFCEKLGAEHKHEFKRVLKAVALRIDHKEARDIVNRMKPSGEHWDVEQIKSVLASKGVALNEDVHYYLVMNMAYNDYKHTAEKFGIDNPDFYFSIAHDFIEDPDAKEFKVEKYFL